MTVLDWKARKLKAVVQASTNGRRNVGKSTGTQVA
jgi:hypothetical protein